MNFSPLRDYLDLPSSIPYSHYRAYLAQRRIRPRASVYEKFKSLLDAKFVIGGFRLAKVLVTRRSRFQDYIYATGESGIFALESDSPGTEDFRLGDKSKSSYSRSGGVTFAIQES